MTSLGDLDPLEVLREDLNDDNVEVQLDAIRALPTISLALGPERTAQELFAALDQYCFPVEVQAAKSPEAYSNTDSLAAKEEVLCEISIQLSPLMMEYAGGSAAAAKYMLPLLEKLAMVEETVIRQAAISSLSDVCRAMKIEDVRGGNGGAMAILTRLAEADWFTSRVSASALTPSLYAVLTFEEDRKQILEIHRRLCMDDMPMVKQSAYQNLVLLIDCMQSHQLILTYTKTLVENLTSELMENMRQCIVDITLKIAEKTVEEKQQDIVPTLIRAAVEDDSWRVRKHLSASLASICKHLAVDKVVQTVGPLYTKLLQDSEPQVRKASILIFEDLLSIKGGACGAKMAANLISGPVQALASDSVAEVREALAEQISFIGQYLEAQVAQEKLLPILKKLASDESPQTRLNLCSKLSAVSSILGMELFEAEILPLLNEVTIDQKWRVRNSIVTNIAQIGIQMGADKFRESRLRDILLQSLKDPASTVRETAALQVHLLNDEFGFEWMQQFIFEEMNKIYSQSGNYLHRMVPLKAIQLMAASEKGQRGKKGGLSSPAAIEYFTGLLRAGLKDNISNVRFTACRVLRTVLMNVKFPKDSKFKEEFKEVLAKMAKSDADEDVKFFAQEALESI